jgi:hypothetical protein
MNIEYINPYIWNNSHAFRRLVKKMVPSNDIALEIALKVIGQVTFGLRKKRAANWPPFQFVHSLKKWSIIS